MPGLIKSKGSLKPSYYKISVHNDSILKHILCPKHMLKNTELYSNFYRLTKKHDFIKKRTYFLLEIID